MSSRMPDFEMPPERARGEAGEPERDGRPDVARPRRVRLVVGVVAASAVIVAAGGSVLVQRLMHDAARADVESVRVLAQSYLDAIQEGRAAEATALAPVDGDASLLIDAVLGGAERISGAEVGAVDVDGDAALVQVSYRAWGGPVERSLDAERVTEGWELTTSLAEAVALHDQPALGIAPTIGGMPLALDGSTLLYPGAYGTDPYEAALWAYEPGRVIVDGMPGGRPFGVVLSPRGASPDDPFTMAHSHLAACQADGSCPIADGALTSQGTSAVLALGADGGMTVRIGSTVLRSGEQGPVELVIDVHAAVAEDGTVTWTCAGPVAAADAGGAEPRACLGDAP